MMKSSPYKLMKTLMNVEHVTSVKSAGNTKKKIKIRIQKNKYNERYMTVIKCMLCNSYFFVIFICAFKRRIF